MDKKEEFTKEAYNIREKLISLNNKIDEEIERYVTAGDNDPKTNETYDNICNARDWVSISTRKLELAIRNLENRSGYKKEA